MNARLSGRKLQQPGAQASPAVIIALPERSLPAHELLIADCRKRAEDLNLRFSTYRATKYSVADSMRSFTKPMEVLGQIDAFSLYKSIHDAPTSVFSVTAVHIRLDPSSRTHKRNLRSLDGFVRYKANFALIRSLNDIDEAFIRFQTWIESVQCSGEDDPRILPFHSFETEGEWTSLGQTSVDALFEQKYGRSALRTDDGKRRWRKADRHEHHGSANQIVAGRRLAGGFHWDLTPGANSTRLLTPHQVWKLSNRRAYLNIYPNGMVRRTNKAAGSHLEFEATRRTRSR
jgi:hypothetical protein